MDCKRLFALVGLLIFVPLPQIFAQSSKDLSATDTLFEMLDEVVLIEEISSTRGQLKQVEGTAIFAGKKSEVINLQNLVLNKGANTTRQLFSGITGLTIYENDDAGLQLSIGGRGLDPNRSSNFNVRQNGYEISADPLGYPESYYTPTSEGVQKISVVRGAASLQYGTQFGGLLNFQMKGPGEENWAVESRNTFGSFGLWTNFTSLSFNSGKLSGYAYYNRRSSQGFRPHSSFEADHTYSTLIYKPTIRTTIAVEHTYLNYLAQQPGGLTDSQFASDPWQSNRDRNWFKVDWQLYQARLNHKFSASTTLSTTATALVASRQSLGFRGVPGLLNSNPISAIDEREPEDGYVYPRDLISGTFNNLNFESKLLHRYILAGHRNVALAGVKIFEARNESRQGAGSNGADADFRHMDDLFPEYPAQSSFTFPNTNYAAFAEHIFYRPGGWSITPGLRYEYIRTRASGTYQNVVFDNAGNVIFSETLNDERDLPRGLLLAGIGVSYKPVTDKDKSREWYANLSQNYRSVTFSDIRTVSPTFIISPDISDERGGTFDLGLRGKQGKLGFDVNTFAMLYANRIGIVFNNRAQRVRRNIGTAAMYGIESFLTYDIFRHNQFSSSIFSNIALTDSRYLLSEEPNVEGKRVEFIPLVNAKVGTQVSYKNWSGSAQMMALTRQFTDVENSESALPGDPREGILGPIPAYAVADLSGRYRAKHWSVDFGINNLFNANYFTRRALGYPGPGILPSAPRNFYVGIGVDLKSKKKPPRRSTGVLSVSE